MAEHKAEIREFETYFEVENSLPLKIKEVVDLEWLEAIQSPTLGCLR